MGIRSLREGGCKRSLLLSGALTTGCALAVLIVPSYGEAGRPSALRSSLGIAAARQMSLQEQGHLRLVKSNGFNKLYEEGRGSGTFPNVTIRAKVTIVSTSEGAFAFSAYAPGGVLSGQGRTHDYQSGAIDYFTGVLLVRGGSGRYAHAYGNLALKGAVSRPSYALALEVSGKLHV